MSLLRARPDFPLLCRGQLILLLIPLLAITSCHRKNATLNEPIDQLYQTALQKMQKKKYYAARSLFQTLQARIPQEDREMLPLVQLKLADSYFLSGGVLNLGEALTAYRSFLTYYPQREEAAYAQFQVGMSLYGQVLAPDRDQELTFKAITEFEKVERLYPDSSYVAKAQSQILLCREKLAAHNFVVGNFYYRRKNFLGAADRYRFILDKYPQYSRTEETLFLLGNCLVATLNPDEARLYYVRLVQEYPKGRYFHEAQARLKEIEKG
ncbi:MAG: outer membrane protein assembly factor BamD [Acidobacteria bacterium]|nr:outer membrane protein assembly factor BamD [Acidobacteriota bacterium]